MMAVRARRHPQDPDPPLQAVTSEPFLIQAAGIIRRHRISIGSLWRKLNPGQQALLNLVYLRKGETFASLAGLGPPPGGMGVGVEHQDDPRRKGDDDDDRDEDQVQC
jgi:hypothetical protein